MGWFARLFRAERYDPDTDNRARAIERMTRIRRERAEVYRRARKERNYLADRLVRQFPVVEPVREVDGDGQH